jgi:hypothetical protein
MRAKLKVAMMALGLSASSAFAESAHRLVVVVGDPSDARVRQQNEILSKDASALRDRDVGVQDLTAADAARRPELGVTQQASFEVLLVGKDGTVKMRHTEPVPASVITSAIDSMPMRQTEGGH